MTSDLGQFRHGAFTKTKWDRAAVAGEGADEIDLGGKSRVRRTTPFQMRPDARKSDNLSTPRGTVPLRPALPVSLHVRRGCARGGLAAVAGAAVQWGFG